MTDPTNALVGFQEELLRLGAVPFHLLRQSSLDSNLFAFDDEPMGEPRHTYVRLNGLTVTAMVLFAPTYYDDLPCLDIGYATPKAYRNQGRAKEIINAAIADMKQILRRLGAKAFYVRGIIAADNHPSRRVAEQLISDKPEAITDSLAGVPAFRYTRRIECD